MTDTHDATKVEAPTDRLHAAGVLAARDTINWWTRRLTSYQIIGDEKLIASAERQIATQQKWLDDNA